MNDLFDALKDLPPLIRATITDDGAAVLDRWTIALRRLGWPAAAVDRAAMTAALTSIEMQMLFRTSPRRT